MKGLIIKKKAILLSVIAVILLGGIIFLFASPKTVTCDRNVRFFVIDDGVCSRLESADDSEILDESFEYLELSVDVTICKSVFGLDSAGSVQFNGAYHNIYVGNLKDNGVIYSNLTDFRPAFMHTHSSVISDDFDCFGFNPACEDNNDTDAPKWVCGRFGKDPVTVGDLKECVEKLGGCG